MELELKNISIILSNKKILKSIDLKVEDGEFISLLGASGCGKTTLLKTIAGIINQDEGSIFLGGNLADRIPPYKRKTVIVFQDFRLFPHLTVAENISFPLKMIGINKNDCKKEAIKLLEKVELQGFEDKHVNNMSGGQMQRVALARALAAKPTVLLLDEPFSSLDINLREIMRELVLDLQKEYKMTTILVTHDQKEALTMSDRIAFMHNGHIEQCDTPEKIFKNPINTLVADYFSTGVYIEGEIINNKFISDLFNFNIEKTDGKYKCLIRPLAIKLNKDDNGDFIVSNKVYQGNNYSIKLSHTSRNLKLESSICESEDIEIGHRVNIKLDKDKLIFIEN
ncbi:MAG: ABC transporter ATP-binding protein [Tissierella sp.]|uniref:ABC transporter ATP-binding protein n=1 Tax=Tissierella sp. TaxID=41274 RepID=UPI003F9D9E42